MWSPEEPRSALGLYWDPVPTLLIITIYHQFANESCCSPLMDIAPYTKDNRMHWFKKKKKKDYLLSFRLYLHIEKPEELKSSVTPSQQC